jgi:hypothetical protein
MPRRQHPSEDPPRKAGTSNPIFNYREGMNEKRKEKKEQGFNENMYAPVGRVKA